MKVFVQISILTFLISVSSSCQLTNPNDKIILDKNKCYDHKLTSLKKTHIYNEVMSAFRDTFPLLRTSKEYFGVPEVVNNLIDEAVFFKRDSSECMLIVLQKLVPRDFIFGSVRMVRGIKQAKKWKFKASLSFNFEKDYFELFKENTFENISKLARYSVLTDGDINRKGCEIDDHYWFIHLKN